MKRSFILTAVLFCLTVVSAPAETVDRIAAVVNNDIITTYQLDQEVADRLADQANDPEISHDDRQALRREVLSKLIEEDLIRQRVDELGIKVSEEDVEAAVQDVEKQNKLTRSQLEEALKAQGMTMAEYRENLRRQILRFKLLGREVQSKVEVTNQEIREYFREHIDDYREVPYVRISRITFSIPERATSVQIESVRKKGEEALAKLKNGEDFYTVLLDYSADKSAEGGDMGKFDDGQLTPAFARAVKDLKEGEISGLVETPKGFHILKVTERSNGTIRQFDAVKDEIRQTLQDKKSQERYKEWAAGLKKNAFIDIRL